MRWQTDSGLRGMCLVALLAATACVMPPTSGAAVPLGPPDRRASATPEAPPADDSDLANIGENFWRAVRDRDEKSQIRDFAKHLKRTSARHNLRDGLGWFTWLYGALKSWRQTSKQVDRGDSLWKYELQCSRAMVYAELSFNQKTRHIVDLNVVRQPVYVAARTPEVEDTVSWVETTVGPDLGATIAVPRGGADGKRAAVVLLGDGGPWDRDETDGPLRPFRDLGDGLAARGVITMRFDKRSFVMSGAFNGTYTLDEDLIQDGISAVEAVRRQPAVDPAKVFLVGHGLGGLAAVAVARRAGGIAGLVLAGVPARPLLYVHLEVLREQEDDEDVLARAAYEVQAIADRTATPNDIVLGVPAHFWYDLAGRDTIRDLRALGRPVLFLRGEDDGYATAIDHRRWMADLAGLRVRSETVPLVDHQLVAAPVQPLTDADLEAGAGPRVPHYVLDMIADFVAKSAARPAKRSR